MEKAFCFCDGVMILSRDVLRLNISNGADFGFSAALSGSIRGVKKVADIQISGYPNIRISDLQTDFMGNEQLILLKSPLLHLHVSEKG